MSFLTLSTLSTILLTCSPVQGEDALTRVRAEVKKTEKNFALMSSKYRVIKTVSRDIIKESADKSKTLSVSDKIVDGIWHGEKYATKSVDNRQMGDGSKLVRKFISAYDGKESYQNANFETGSILNGKIVAGAVNPRLIAAPLHVAGLGSLDQILDIQLKKVPFGSFLQYWKKFQYKHLGEEKIEGLKCHKIQILTLDPKPPEQPVLKQILWIAPERSWQIVASENHHLRHIKGASSTARVTDWKKIKDKTWIPLKAEINHFEHDKLGKRRLSMREEFQLIDCTLKCDPKNKRFQDVEFHPEMKVQFLDIKKHRKK